MMRAHSNLDAVFQSGTKRLIWELNFFPELDAKRLMLDLCETVFLLHSNKIWHRNLNPENVLKISKIVDDDDLLVAISGFRLAKTFEQDVVSEKPEADQVLYTAPELLQEDQSSCYQVSLKEKATCMFIGKKKKFFFFNFFILNLR